MNYSVKHIILGGCMSVAIVAGSYMLHRLYKKYANIVSLMRFTKTTIVPEAHIHDKHIAITYIYQNTPYVVRLPYDRTKVVQQTQYLVKSVVNDTEMDITQQPGVPYLINSEDLDVDKIIVVDCLLEEERVFYKTKPYYGK